MGSWQETQPHRMARFALSMVLSAAAVPAVIASEAPADAPGAPLASVVVRAGAAGDATPYDGVVQAVRQTVLAAQVPGAVVALDVKAGDMVKAGQVLMRLDARAAEQAAAAGHAQVQAARASRDEASREFERQKQLFDRGYISRAALDRAEAQYKTARAQADAQLASAGAARTQSGFYVVRAPYGAVVAEVDVVLGDMAMPGRPLLTLYDPGALRVSTPVPQTVAARAQAGAGAQAEVPGAVPGRINPVKVQWLPTVDPSTHTLELRLDLPPGLRGVAPGMFARAWLPGASGDDGRIFVPTSAIVRRAELAGVYVVGADGRPLLRQVRLGRARGDTVEVLSGVAVGDRVALDPQAAARAR
ncbi:MAG TPA: efflux RND transporter periplasmic adaptor subunit [Burkholderiaceae bacterium]|nr:efflux RND transporter periplasmic adaptor subunit [Burkholderiaceae bacterium]